ASGHGVDEDVLARGMSAVADCAEAVQRGDAERGRKISVRASAGGAFAQRDIHLLGEQLGAGEETRAHFALERRAVEAAGDFKPSASLNRAQAAQTNFEVAHVGNTKRTQIEDSASAFRNYVGARTAFDDPGVDGDSAVKIIPFFNARDLPRQFVNGVDAFLWCKACMRSAAMHDQCGFANSFARRLQQPVLAKGRFQDKNSVTAARLRFEMLARRFAPDLLIGSPKEDDAFLKLHSQVLKCPQRE